LTPAIELTAHPAMRARVLRQTAVSAVVLGLICWLAAAALDAHAAIVLALGAGWVLMPTVLALSTARPRLRLALVVPAGLVSTGLVAVVATALPDDATSRVGWILITAGVLVGGVLGSWFWYRLLPVPPALESPLAPGRWILIALHVALVLAGVALVALDQFG
jgi:hypothetical protein